MINTLTVTFTFDTYVDLKSNTFTQVVFYWVTATRVIFYYLSKITV